MPLAPPQVRSDSELVRSVEDFLYFEADVLDEWRLHEWLALFAENGRYLIPSTDKPDGDPTKDLFLVQDDRFLLEQRVNSLQTRAAHAEYPHSRTRRLVTNIKAVESGDGHIDVRANFAVFRARNAAVDTFFGRYQHVLEHGDEGFRFLTRKSILDLEALRPHGKVSIIL